MIQNLLRSNSIYSVPFRFYFLKAVTKLNTVMVDSFKAHEGIILAHATLEDIYIELSNRKVHNSFVLYSNDFFGYAPSITTDELRDIGYRIISWADQLEQH